MHYYESGHDSGSRINNLSGWKWMDAMLYPLSQSSELESRPFWVCFKPDRGNDMNGNIWNESYFELRIKRWKMWKWIREDHKDILMYHYYPVDFLVVFHTGGLLAGSLAIMTDAAHMLSDFAAFLISLFAIWVARWLPDKKRTFGYYRAGILKFI